MSQPTPYNRLYNFTDYQTVNPTKPLPATNLDAELNAIELTLDETTTNLALIQRDDGKLVNQLVTPESLSAATLAIISQGEYNPRGNWAASTAYAVGDLVTYNAATYLCIVANTSTPSFATDNSSGYWLLIANGALQGGGQAVDTFSGNASQTIFTLSYNYASSNAATVFVSGVALIPTQDFTISGTTLTFVSAPPSPSVAGRKNIMVRGTGVEAQLAADLANTASANAQGYADAALASKNAAATSATAAAASQSAAATSATAAAASQSAASASQTAAATSATNAATSASAASSSQSAAATSATNAAASASTATTQATTATTQATNAASSATAAANSASSAATSATTATTKASDATTAANNAAASATAAGTSSTSAASSATSATNSATTATNAATTATTQASNAATSASSANTSATNAASSATSASTSATAAAASAAAALTSKNNAATSEANAATSATSAATSATSAATSLDAFKKNYQGASATAPTTRYDGSALQVGDLYFNTTTNAMQVRASSGWTNAGSSVNGTSRRFRYVATADQTTFTGADANSNTLVYDAGFIDVYLNGSRLDETEFTATSGTSVVIGQKCAASDEVNIVAYGTFQVANLNGADLQNATVTGQKLVANTVTPDKLSSDAQYIGFKNRIINGACAIDQRNNGNAITPSIDGGYFIDRFQNQSSTIRSATTLQRVPVTVAGFTNAIKVTNNSNTTVGTGDYYAVGQIIEGYSWADLQWGTSGAQTVTFSCWVYGSIAGTFGGLLKEYGQSRSYPFLYTIAANTWTQIFVTIPGDTSGTYAKTNSGAVWIELSLACGSTYQGTPNAWNSSVNVGAVGQSNAYLTTTGATFYTTGWQLEKGSTATSFDYRPYGTELALCQRYYEIGSPITVMFPWSSGSQIIRGSNGFAVTKRAAPTVTLFNKSSGTGSLVINATSVSGYGVAGSGGASDVVTYDYSTASAEL